MIAKIKNCLSKYIEISNLYSDEHRTIEIYGKKFHWPFPISCMLHSSSAIVLGWHIYGDNCPKIVDHIHTILTAISDKIYAFKYRFVKSYKYNVIYTDLPPGYYDQDTRLLYGAMQCLCEYVKECGGQNRLADSTNSLLDEKHRDPNEPPEVMNRQASNQSEAIKIYYWWKKIKPAEEKRRDELCMLLHSSYKKSDNMTDDEYCTLKDEFRNLEDKIQNDEQAMLHRLIDIRYSLWT